VYTIFDYLDVPVLWEEFAQSSDGEIAPKLLSSIKKNKVVLAGVFDPG
jgi:hypothetical protein